MDQLRQERLRRGLSLEEAAQAMGFGVDEPESWESGGSEPFGSQLVVMYKFYGCSPDYLLGLVEERDAGLGSESLVSNETGVRYVL